MKYQSPADSKHSVEENLRLEAAAHDEDYEDLLPFGLPTMEFSIEQVWARNDHAHKPGTYRRGWRKRRLFEMMDLPNLRGKRVLEVGCGQGHNGVFIAQYGAEVHGFDLSRTGVEMANRIAKANGVDQLCHFRVANASEMPYEDEFFDVLVCNAVLHHTMKYPGVRDESYRVLKPGGRLFFAEGVRDNVVYRLVRSAKRALRPVHYHGDVDLEMSDLVEFTESYSSVSYERFGLIEKFTQGFGRNYDNNLLVRSLYFAGYCADRLLLAVVPALRRQCLEVVGVAIK